MQLITLLLKKKMASLMKINFWVLQPESGARNTEKRETTMWNYQTANYFGDRAKQFLNVDNVRFIQRDRPRGGMSRAFMPNNTLSECVSYKHALRRRQNLRSVTLCDGAVSTVPLSSGWRLEVNDFEMLSSLLMNGCCAARQPNGQSNKLKT